MTLRHQFKKAPLSWSNGRDECFATVTIDSPGEPWHGEQTKCGEPEHRHIHLVKATKEAASMENNEAKEPASLMQHGLYPALRILDCTKHKSKVKIAPHPYYYVVTFEVVSSEVIEHPVGTNVVFVSPPTFILRDFLAVATKVDKSEISRRTLIAVFESDESPLRGLMLRCEAHERKSRSGASWLRFQWSLHAPFMTAALTPQPDPPFTPSPDEPERCHVYSWGLCSLSICVPAGMDRELVEGEANKQHPTGVSRWKVADEPFATGQENPCACNDDSNRLHYLLHC